MKYGYMLNAWNDEGIKVPIELGSQYKHALWTGGTGSGKSTCLITELGFLVKEGVDDIRVCDYKKSEDFSFMQGYKHYYAGDSAYDGIMNYYVDFTKERQEGMNHKQHLLVVDEYPSLINFLQTHDRIDKTKKANDVMAAVAEILMLGRGIGFGIWIVTQVASATLFANGARDNFQVVCALGRLSKEQKQMLFSGEDIPTDTLYGPGEGLLFADGKELVEVKYPMITNLDNWKEHIRQALISSGGETKV